MSACGAEDGDDSATEQVTTEEAVAEPDEDEPVEGEPAEEPAPEPKKEYDGKALVAKVKRAANAGTGGRSFQEMCNPTEQNWQCFYSGITSKHEGRLDLKLTFPGGVDEKEPSKQGRMWFLNMTGRDVPEFKQIVSYNSQGLDTGTSDRSDSPILDDN